MGNKGSIIGSIASSVVIMSIIMYFMVPGLIEAPTGLILQTVIKEDNTVIEKLDDDSEYTIIPSMTANVTTSGNSSLCVTFDNMFFLYYQPAMIEGTALNFNITVDIQGVTNKSMAILFQKGVDNAGEVFATFLPCSVFIELETGNLPANTYNISVWWKSVANPLGFNSLKTGNLYAENTYTLKIREISL